MKFCIARSVFAAAFMVMSMSTVCHGQSTAYFVDGYHGGVYGHFPRWQTNFMVDQLEANPEWKIALEIEPETWDSVRVYDPNAYARFVKAVADPVMGNRIEFVNPSFGQSYLYTVSGESVIRQFALGIKRTNYHFPSATFQTYSSEEPCFTSALPQILTSFGFKYAVLKNPNTCWGGYMRAFGHEKVSWIGPDGTAIPAVTRYTSEGFEKNSTWQTTAWSNSPTYVDAALASGIKNPVGMCLQDAGWKHGPWLKTISDLYQPSVYTLWRDYFSSVSIAPAAESWRVTQDDVKAGLVWGSQILQKLAREVRHAENRVVMAEKIAALNSVFRRQAYPAKACDQAWRTLLLGQHHDCWIVPYNGKPGNTWADKTKVWTDNTLHISDSIILASLPGLTAASADAYVNVYNTTATARISTVSVPLSTGIENAAIADAAGATVPSQIITDNGQRSLVFSATIPSVGKSTYRLTTPAAKLSKPKSTVAVKGDLYVVTTDQYELVIDGKQGGIIKSIKAKLLNNREFVDNKSASGFNELRGFFYEQGKFLSSRTQPATVMILEDGPVRTRLSVSGSVADQPFTQIITLNAHDPKIDVILRIDWKGNPGIGKYSQTKNFDAKNPEKAFYNDRYKLLTLFPAKLTAPHLYKDAPFDVTETKEENTFYNRWDSIKNNVMLNWADLAEAENGYGLALLTDHTTSYAYGKNHPLGLTIQYSGVGLWGRDYKITRPTEVHYALMPHKGKWDTGEVAQQATFFKEDVIASISNDVNAVWSASWLMLEKGWELSALQRQGDDLLVRVFNASGTGADGTLVVNSIVTKADEVELNGETRKPIPVSVNNGSSSVRLAMPRFGIRTVRLKIQ